MRIHFLLLVCFVIGFTPAAIGAAETTSEPITAILGAQTREISLLRDEMTSRIEHRILGIPFWEGRLAGRRAVIARMSGGKVNAAMFATLMAEHFHPHEIIVTGIAGGLNPKLQPGDLVIAAKTAQHDMVRHYESGVEHRGARHPITGRRNPVFLEPPPKLLATAQQAATHAHFIPVVYGDTPATRTVHVVTGIVATGDAFVESGEKRTELREQLTADAVEMEGAAVAQVCYVLNVPCLVIRCLSDLADGTAMADLETFADLAAVNSARLVYEILRLLAENESTTPSPGRAARQRPTPSN